MNCLLPKWVDQNSGGHSDQEKCSPRPNIIRDQDQQDLISIVEEVTDVPSGCSNARPH